jgi:carbon-monoxide dehydrogenase medium subunit
MTPASSRILVAPSLETYGEDGKGLAGGQSLLPVLALRLSHLGYLIDIGRVQGLQSIEVDDSPQPPSPGTTVLTPPSGSDLLGSVTATNSRS